MDTSKTTYLFFDFDGTITADTMVRLEDGTLKRQRILPKSHLDSIKKAHDLGHKIFLCTGRSRGSVIELGKEWQAALDLPWNGMLFGASDIWYEGNRIAIDYIPRNECLSWLDYCKETNRIFCYNGSNNTVRYDFSAKLTEAEISEIYSDLEKQLSDNPITNFSTIPAAHDFDMSKTELTAVHLSTYTDVFPKGCNKGSAIQRFCKLTDIDIRQTICFGDSENDIDMFKVCNTSVAMKKAPETLKALASYVAETELGVSEAISHFFI